MTMRKIATVTLTGHDRYGADVEASGETTKQALARWMEAARLSEQVHEQIAACFVDSRVTAQQVALLDATAPARKRQLVPPMPRDHYPAPVEPTATL